MQRCDETQRVREVLGARNLHVPSWRLPTIMLAAFGALWLLLAIEPVSREDWLLENLLVIMSVPLLVATRNRVRFSNTSYVCLFVFFVLHAVGAHYTYSLVPYEQWAQDLTGGSINEAFGWERNQYDRLVHLLYGALMMPPAADLLAVVAPPRGLWKWLLPVMFVTSHAVIYELVEWFAALLVAPELGDAYLGTQGDAWDAQKDMALALAGSVVAMTLCRLARRPEP